MFCYNYISCTLNFPSVNINYMEIDIEKTHERAISGNTHTRAHIHIHNHTTNLHFHERIKYARKAVPQKDYSVFRIS